jgi:DNA excision repair protein ERCC-6
MNASKKKHKKKTRSPDDAEGGAADSGEEDGEMAESSDDAEAVQEDVEFSGGFRVPRALYDRLFPYQRTAVKWMWELHCQEAGGIIGDEMGLGKTVQTVAFLAGLHHSGLLDAPVLLLCPATIMAQWVRHFHEWYPPLRVVVVHDSGSHARAAGSGRNASAEKLVREAFRRGGVVVTTYDHLRMRADLMASQVPT